MDARQSEIRFLIRLARGLHMYGMPAHRIEETLEVAAARLGIPSQFFSLPTIILAAFGDPEHRSTSLIRVQPGSDHLEKLVLLDGVMKNLVRGLTTAEMAAARVEEIESAPERWGPLAQIGACALISACAARFVDGGVRELLAAALLGGVTAALAHLNRLRKGFDRVYVPTAAFVVSFLAAVTASQIGGISSYLVTTSSLIVLLPGLMLTLAITELAAQSLVSGTVQLVSALVVLFELVAGVALGRTLAEFLFGPTREVASVALPAWTEAIALVAAPFAYCVRLRARLRDALPILAACVLGIVGARVGGWIRAPGIGLDFGAFVGAFLVTVASNLWARRVDRPPAVTQLPGLLLLVPGSVGFRSVMSLLESNVANGVEAAARMMFLAASLVAGLLLASIAVPARRQY